MKKPFLVQGSSPRRRAPSADDAEDAPGADPALQKCVFDMRIHGEDAEGREIKRRARTNRALTHAPLEDRICNLLAYREEDARLAVSRTHRDAFEPQVGGGNTTISLALELLVDVASVELALDKLREAKAVELRAMTAGPSRFMVVTLSGQHGKGRFRFVRDGVLLRVLNADTFNDGLLKRLEVTALDFQDGERPCSDHSTIGMVILFSLFRTWLVSDLEAALRQIAFSNPQGDLKTVASDTVRRALTRMQRAFVLCEKRDSKNRKWWNALYRPRLRFVNDKSNAPLARGLIRSIQSTYRALLGKQLEENAPDPGLPTAFRLTDAGMRQHSQLLRIESRLRRKQRLR